MMMKPLIVMLAVCAFSSWVHAGGIAVGTTRVIYYSNDREASLQVSNTDKKDIYLVQSWVTNLAEKKTKQFIITPPLFKSSPGNKNQLRIVFIGKPLPQDRESVFWVNVKSIPSISSESLNKNTLQLAIKTVIKLFYRPSVLTIKPSKAALMIDWERTKNGVKASNKSPYYVTVSSFEKSKKIIKGIQGYMMPPFSDHVFKGKNIEDKGHIIFKIVNDYGGLTTINYDLANKHAKNK